MQGPKQSIHFPQLPPLKVLITGANGMLGRAFVDSVKKHFPQFELRALTQSSLDITKPEDWEKQAKWIEGGWIIHCAGLVSVEHSETEPARAEKILVDGTRFGAELAEKTGAKFFFPQSFLIYDGKTNPITEETDKSPLSRYGHFKLAAEEIVRSTLPDSIAACIGGFFGGDDKDKNFVGKIVPILLQKIKAGERSIEVGDRVWQPTYTSDVANNSLLLMAARKSGYYLMASHGEASFHDVALKVAECLDLPIEIKKISSSVVSRREIGVRPERAVLLNRRLQAEGMDFQRTWSASLADYLSRPYFKRLRDETLSA